MNKLRVNEVVIVEGKYDATVLAGLIDGLILTTDGFSIYSDGEKKELIQKLGRQRGLLILTDSDAAGFQIRSYIQKIAAGCSVKHAYIPAVAGKEARKSAPSKEGTLGVEGLPPHVLREALERAGITSAPLREGREITYTDLYACGLSGGEGSATRRRALLHRIGLPARLSKKALVQVLSSLYSYEEFMQLTQPKPVLFWDFHATLSLPDGNWFVAASEAAAQYAGETPLEEKTLIQHLSGTCLPWWSIPERDTRHLVPNGAWWAHCEREFAAMYQRCGLTPDQAARCAPHIREKILQPARYCLYPDALSTLRELQKRGYRQYILSNNFPELEQITNALGLAPLLSGVVVSGKIGYDKPRPEIFEAALRLAGNPEEAIMIGDNPIDDIEGGKAAGLKTIAVHGVQAPAAEYCVGELAEMLQILR